ncbi:MAG TPA: hypothetical protein VIZ30_12040, partial [Pseudomonadales bacterium]
MTNTAASPNKRVRHFRQILLWPLQLMPLREGAQIQRHWEVLQSDAASNPWHEVIDEFGGAPGHYQERHYNELVTFLPYVQRFLYGEGDHSGADPDSHRHSPMRVFRRDDIHAVRLLSRPDAAPIQLTIAHVDLYFFFDIDVTLLNVEVYADDLPLDTVQDLLYRFGRAYPAGWDAHGQGIHSMYRIEWLAADGSVLATSDSNEREKFLTFVGAHRTPRIGAQWAHLLHPLVQDHTATPGLIRYRQIEYYRMPVMAYLGMDDVRALSRNDFVRIGLVAEAGDDSKLPYADAYVDDFERRYCFDRFWSRDGGVGHNTRYMCCGHALVVVGDAHWPFFTNRDTGVLAQFRHQHFLLFLIAHFQKAALLMMSDQLVHALERLEVGNPDSVKRFKRAIRQRFEIFLRFTHRYWFHDISEQATAKALFKMCAEHLGLDPLYAEVKEHIHDMDEYLDSDSLRRQANTVVRLTVVTVFGLIGTVTTGFLGMNLIAAADEPTATRVIGFGIVLALTGWLTLYTIVKSKRLSDILDALSDERLAYREKLAVIWQTWRGRPRTK